MATSSSTAPRTIKALAAYEPGLIVKPFEYASRPLGANDVEIQISHCGICGTDVHTISGGWGGANYPVVPGHEIVGTISALGAGVAGLRVGDRVGVGAMAFSCQDKSSCKECARGEDQLCPKAVYTYGAQYADGAKSQGGYADFVRVSATYAFKIPDAIPSAEAAPLLCAGVTVYTPLKKHVKAGMRVGVVGIGGLGHLGLQFAKALGAVPVAFSQSPSKEQAARELGAVEFVVMSNAEAVEKAKRSVDVLLVTADAENQPWDTYLSFVAVNGKLVLVGAPNDSIKFSPFSLIPGAISFVGSLFANIEETKEMFKLAAEKGVRPVIQKVPMTKANEGLAMVDQGKVRYRVVLEN